MVLGLLAPVLPFLRPRLPESRIHGPSPGAREGSEQGRRSWAMEPTFLLAVLANTVQGFAYFIPLLWLPCTLALLYDFITFKSQPTLMSSLYSFCQRA